jgi:uncharacterized protein YdaU (DUF1376 family)
MARGKPPAFLLNVDDWLSSTSVKLMSPAERSAYLQLLCHEWKSDDCGLPNDAEELAVLADIGDQWGKASRRVLKSFRLINGRYYNMRLLREWHKCQYKSERASDAGRKSASVRGAKEDDLVQLPFSDGSTDVKETLNGSAAEIQQRAFRVKDLNLSSEVLLEEPRWKKDYTFVEFVCLYLTTGCSFIDEDFSKAYEVLWKRFSWEQKSERMKALQLRLQEFIEQPRYVPRPLKFIDEEWKRKPKPSGSKPNGKISDAEAIAQLSAFRRTKPNGNL